MSTMLKKAFAWGIPFACFAAAVAVHAVTLGLPRIQAGGPPRSQTCRAPKINEQSSFYNFIFGKNTSFYVTGTTIFNNPAVQDGTLDVKLVDPQNANGFLTTFQLPPSVQDLGKHPSDPNKNARCLCVCVWYPPPAAAGGNPAQYAFSLGVNEPLYGLSTPIIAAVRPKTFVVGNQAVPCFNEDDIGFMQLIRTRDNNVANALIQESFGFSNTPPDYVLDAGGEEVIFANPYPPKSIPKDPSFSGRDLESITDADKDVWTTYADMPGAPLPTLGVQTFKKRTLDFKTFFFVKADQKLHGDFTWGDQSDVTAGGGAEVKVTSRQALQFVDEPTDQPTYVKTVTLYFSNLQAQLKKFLPK